MLLERGASEAGDTDAGLEQQVGQHVQLIQAQSRVALQQLQKTKIRRTVSCLFRCPLSCVCEDAGTRTCSVLARICSSSLLEHVCCHVLAQKFPVPAHTHTQAQTHLHTH
jgi:hypothetical protein